MVNDGPHPASAPQEGNDFAMTQERGHLDLCEYERGNTCDTRKTAAAQMHVQAAGSDRYVPAFRRRMPAGWC
jgi:hypothetical protein